MENGNENVLSHAKNKMYSLRERLVFNVLILSLSFQNVRKEFDGFERLFSRFLQENSTVDWEKIQLLPHEAVSIPTEHILSTQ